ncbi:MAG: ABC transporter permease [Candidatus Omnitrophica bacterium]|nr:ABC transporter permease [Candidatus Omnitrophota bacterium]
MNTGPSNRPTVIRTPRHSNRWALELLWTLSIHRVSLRYKETLFGFGWIFLQPIALTIIFNYIHRVARIPTGDIPYPLFAAVGLVVWSLTALTTSQSVVTVAGEVMLLKRIALPRILLPMSAVVSSLADLCVMGLMLVGLFLHYHISISWEVGWIPALFLIHLSLLIGISCLVSLANVFLRDIGHAIPSLLQLWFFASPVFYPSSMVPKEFVFLSRWNPMTGLIEGYRAALLLGKPPPQDLLWPAMIVSLAIMAIGAACFRQMEGSISDIL